MTKPGLIAFRIECAGETSEEVESNLKFFSMAVLDKIDVELGDRLLESTSEFIGPAMDEHGEPYVYGRINYRVKGDLNG